MYLPEHLWTGCYLEIKLLESLKFQFRDPGQTSWISTLKKSLTSNIF